jgi:hypothetical protein
MVIVISSRWAPVLMIGLSGHRVGEGATVGHERCGNEHLRCMFVHGAPAMLCLVTCETAASDGGYISSKHVTHATDTKPGACSVSRFGDRSVAQQPNHRRPG